jgi:hypothetical protein
MPGGKIHVRFASDSRHQDGRDRCPLSANRRPEQVQRNGCHLALYADKSSGSALASLRSSVSKPSVSPAVDQSDQVRELVVACPESARGGRGSWQRGVLKILACCWRATASAFFEIPFGFGYINFGQQKLLFKFGPGICALRLE